MLWMDLEETNKPMSFAYKVSVNRRRPRTKDKALWVLVTESERRGFSPTDKREGFYCFVFFSNVGVARGMKEMKLSCCKCHFDFFTTVANDEEGHPPVPFDILFHTHNDSYNSQTERGSILHLHICHNIPCLPPKHFLYAFVFNFSWGDYKTQEKLNKILGDKQGVLQEMCKSRMLFSTSGVFIYAFTK